jgi:hypothetical protein
MDKLEADLARLSQQARVAFAAACAERVLIIYKYTSQGDIVRAGPGMAVETAWSFASGSTVDGARMDKVKASIDAAYPEPDLGGGPDQFSVSTASYALDAITDTTTKSAWSASQYAVYTIEQIDDEQGGGDEERAWQQRVLQLAASAGNGSVERQAFRALVAEKPQWLERFE